MALQEESSVTLLDDTCEHKHSCHKDTERVDLAEQDAAMTSFQWPPSLKPMIPLCVYIVLSSAGTSMVFPMLPHQRDRYFGSNASSVLWKSICESIGALLGFFFGGMFGLASDAYGRKVLLLISAFEAVIAFAVHAAFGEANPWPFLVLGNICSAIGSTKIGNAAVGFMILADLFEKECRLVPLSIYIIVLFIGVMFAPLPSAMHWSDSTTSCVSAGVLLVTLIYVWLFFEETLPVHKRRAIPWSALENPMVPLRRVFRSRYLTCFAMLGVTFMFPFYLTTAIDLYYLDSKLGSFSTGDNGVLMGIMGFVTIISIVVILPLLTRCLPAEKIVLLGMLSLLANGIAYCLVQTAWQAFTFLSTSAAFSFVGMTMMSQMVSVTVPQNEQGEVNGTLNAIKELSTILGPIAGSLLFSLGRYHIDPANPVIEMPFFASILVTLCGVGIVVFFLMPEVAKRKHIIATQSS